MSTDFRVVQLTHYPTNSTHALFLRTRITFHRQILFGATEWENFMFISTVVDNSHELRVFVQLVPRTSSPETGRVMVGSRRKSFSHLELSTVVTMGDVSHRVTLGHAISNYVSVIKRQYGKGF